MQIDVPPEAVDALADGLDLLIEMTQQAKDHLLECPSVESPEMLCDVVSDYDERVAALSKIRTQIEEKK